MKKVMDIVESLKASGKISYSENFKECFWDYSIAIGDLGTVVSLLSGKILTPHLQKTGYVLIHFDKRGWLLHRLVAKHHVHNPYNKEEVNHLDFDKTNCAASNLVWVNKAENTEHARAAGRYHRPAPGTVWRVVNGKRVTLTIDEASLA